MPFGVLEMRFPPTPDADAAGIAEVHLVTGVNGTGKTRLLCALAAALGNSAPLKQRLSSGTGRVFVNDREVVARGEVTGNTLHNPPPAAAYSGTAYLTDHSVQVLAKVGQVERGPLLEFSKPGGYGRNAAQLISNMKIKAAMSAMKTPGQNLAEVAAVSRPLKLMQKIEAGLSEITGRPFAFRVEEREKDQSGVVVDWGTVSMPYTLLPDGLRSIIGWLVDAAVMLDHMMPDGPEPLSMPCVLLLDEIECHLHPAWQRKILPIAQRVFKNAQIFVATHSPFVICSLNTGWIHKLKADADGMVSVETVPAKPGDSYISVLEDIMGVDEWFDPETHVRLNEFKTEREKALRGNADAAGRARSMGQALVARGPEVADIIQRELHQLERLLAQPLAS